MTRTIHRAHGARALLFGVSLLGAGCSPGGTVSLHALLSAPAPQGRSPGPVARDQDEAILLGTAITPITTTAAASSGFAYAGEAFDVACNVSGSVTLYPAVFGTAWQIYPQYACALSEGVANVGTCIFPSLPGASGLVWNAYKTGTGVVGSCVALARGGSVPAGTVRTSGAGSGSVTSVGLSMPGEFSVSGSPVTSAGTLAAAWVAQAAHLVLAGPSSSSAGPAAPTFRALVAADLPASGVTAGTYGDATHVAQVTVNAQGQTTAATSVAISAGSAVFNLAAQLNSPADNTFFMPTIPVALSLSEINAWLWVATKSYTVSNLQGFVSNGTNGGNLPGGCTMALTVRKNFADTALTCTIPAAGHTCSDATHNVSVVAGDVLTESVVITGCGGTLNGGFGISAQYG